MLSIVSEIKAAGGRGERGKSTRALSPHGGAKGVLIPQKRETWSKAQSSFVFSLLHSFFLKKKISLPAEGKAELIILSLFLLFWWAINLNKLYSSQS